MKAVPKRQWFQALLRKDFKAFVCKVFAEVSPQSLYLDNWHIDVICAELERMIKEENTRLIINIPPRYMKSIICSVAFPAFILGHFPQEAIVCVSYAEELAKKLAADCRRVMESAWYRRIFPNTRLAATRREIMDFETTRGGGRYAATVGGTLTGRGGNWIIIDDPIKPADANSDLIRNKVNDWYGSTLYSRLNDKKSGKILLIMQRTHEQDLTGYLIESKVGFKHIVMPLVALQEEHWAWKRDLDGNARSFHYDRHIGEPLHPKREGLAEIERMKQSMGSAAFASQCQQDPLALGRNIVKWHWFKRYSWEELKKGVYSGEFPILQMMFSWDLAIKRGKENDYSVCICALRTDKGWYILDVKRWKLELPELVKTGYAYMEEKRTLFKRLRYGLSFKILVEEAGCGIGFLQEMQRRYFRSAIMPVRPAEDKETRLQNVTPALEAGRCFLPKDGAVWEADFKHEVLGFPNTKHDDQVDALSQLLSYWKPKTFDFI